MGILNLDEGLRDALKLAERKERWDLLESQEKATKLMKKVIHGDISLGAVQGPPGTGKTSVVEAFARDELSDFITRTEDEIIVYMAPTNNLVYEAFRRISAQLIRAGYDIRDILRTVRVYGSKIKVKNDLKVENGKIYSKDEINGLTGQIDNDVRIVFATEFQRISNKLEVRPEKIHIVADEASKSPYFRVFLPLAEKIARNPEEYYPYSLLVLGDPQQAITVPEEFKDMNVPLLMKLTEKILREHNLKKDHWVMLDTTFRMPRPSENPISHGFYSGRLHAYYTSRERMAMIRDAILDNIDRITGWLDRIGINVSSGQVRSIINGIEEAASSNTPIIVVETRPFRSGDTFDGERVQTAFIVTSIFQLASHFSGYDFTVTTTAPYCDIVDAVMFRFLRRFGKSIRRPRAATVQSIIGGESDIIIATLGKEWALNEVHYYPSEDIETIYKREPELLNVQLSRHRSTMVIIGNTDKLTSLREKRIRRTVEKLKEMDGKGAIFI